MIKSAKSRRSSKGQAMVELAFALPLVLLCLVAIIYFGRAFYTKQILSYAAQEGARSAARIPNLKDSSVRDAVRGFTTDGASTGPDDPASNPSPIYKALSAAHMLDGDDGTHGNLPPGASVKILPWDDGGSSADTVTVEIQYPFGLMVSNKTGQNASDKFGDSVNISLGKADSAIPFANTTLAESASAAQEIFQE